MPGQNIPERYYSCGHCYLVTITREGIKGSKRSTPRELRAVLNNLDTYFKTLLRGVNPLQIKYGFMHPEPLGVVAIDQKGGGAALRQARLYAYPELEPELLHLITLGDKGSQQADIAFCREYVLNLRTIAAENGEKEQDVS